MVGVPPIIARLQVVVQMLVVVMRVALRVVLLMLALQRLAMLQCAYPLTLVLLVLQTYSPALNLVLGKLYSSYEKGSNVYSLS